MSEPLVEQAMQLDNLTGYENEVHNLIKLLPDFQRRKILLNLLRANKPRHWSPTTNAPYYREKFGIELRDGVIIPLMKSGKDKILYYKDYPAFEPNTLYTKVSQAKKYLLDRLDPKGEFELFLQTVRMFKRPGVGIVFEIRKDMLPSNTPLQAKDFTSENLAWKDRMEKFIDEAGEGEEFVADNLALDLETQQNLEIELSQLENVVFKITESKVELYKI